MLFRYRPDSYGSLTYLPLNVLDRLSSERVLPLKGFGLMALIKMRIRKGTFKVSRIV